jgi:hypothetical protein
MTGNTEESEEHMDIIKRGISREIFPTGFLYPDLRPAIHLVSFPLSFHCVAPFDSGESNFKGMGILWPEARRHMYLANHRLCSSRH